MPIVPALCTQCGAAVEVNDTLDAAICPHCQTPFIIQKAIQQYNTTNNYNITGGVVNVNAGPSLEELYKNAKALIMDGAFIYEFQDEKTMTEKSKALHSIYIKMLGIGPTENLMLMLRAAIAITAACCGKFCNSEDITKYLPILRENDPKFYEYLLDRRNKRYPRVISANYYYKGGLLGLKCAYLCKESIDALLVPEEGKDDYFILDQLYCIFWHTGSRKNISDYVYVCQKLYDNLPSSYQNWIKAEYQRREKIQSEIITALKNRNFKLAYDIIDSASVRYPQLRKLLSHFQKTFFSMKCNLSVDPNHRSLSNIYAPTLVFDALYSCPAAVEELKGF